MRNDGTGSQSLACRFENGLEGKVICWGMTGLAHRAWNGVLVRECLGGAGNTMRNDGTVSQGLA